MLASERFMVPVLAGMPARSLQEAAMDVDYVNISDALPIIPMLPVDYEEAQTPVTVDEPAEEIDDAPLEDTNGYTIDLWA